MKKMVIISLAIVIVFLTVLFLIKIERGSDISKMICKGSAGCFEGVVEDIIDGDTLVVSGDTIRLSLVNTPEKWEDNYEAATDFVWDMCPVGTDVIVDEDDLQVSGSHRRIVAVVYCESRGRWKNLNEELLEAGHAEIVEDFCDRSEFADEEWAKFYGCGRSSSS